jgi:hypothetical protein
MNEIIHSPVFIRDSDLCKKCKKRNIRYKCFSYSCDTNNIILYLRCPLCGNSKTFTRKYVPRDQRIDRRQHE